MINKDQFFKKYGKIKILQNIKQRNPVHNTNKKDANRNLMIKFKYGNLTLKEQTQFHESIKKMIYKVMHTNNVMMDWDDVYQEIWKKIIKCRHTWDENKGTMVSTWITIVANSVINTLRKYVNNFNSHYCLYDDFYSSSDENQNMSGIQEKVDSLSYNYNQEDLQDKQFQKKIWEQKYNEFYLSLEECQKALMDQVNEMGDKFLHAYDKKNKIPYNELKNKLGYDNITFNMILYNIHKKYCNIFGKKFEQVNNQQQSKNNYLF